MFEKGTKEVLFLLFSLTKYLLMPTFDEFRFSVMVEIERKFLVDANIWSQEKPDFGILIRQGYLMDTENGVLRVRIKGDKSFLTLKSQTKGFSRLEFEYEIPMDDALEMIEKMCDVTLSKTRYIYEFGNKKWEVDEFHDELSPLILAEVELKSESEEVKLPLFITEEVTYDKHYYNSELIKRIKWVTKLGR